MHLVWLERLGVFTGVLYPDGAQCVCSKHICLKVTSKMGTTKATSDKLTSPFVLCVCQGE